MRDRWLPGQHMAVGFFLRFSGIGLSAQKIIRRYIIETAERSQPVDRHFIGTALISGIHGLRGSKNRCHLCLGQIIIFP